MSIYGLYIIHNEKHLTIYISGDKDYIFIYIFGHFSTKNTTIW